MIKKTRRKPGPKRKEVDVREVKRLAILGMTKKQIAGYFGMNPDTLYERIKENPEISVAYNEGRNYGIQRVSDVVFEKAIKGNTDAAKFYLKCKGDWREGLELTGPEGGPIKQVVLNRAMTPEEWEEKYGDGDASSAD